MLFTVADIVKNFEARDNNRGKAYQAEGRVETLAVKSGGKVIEAAVRGEAAQPYRVFIEILKRGHQTLVESECSCPTGYRCKHAAAALYEALAEDIRTQERRRHPIPMRSAKDKTSSSLPLKLRAWAEKFAPEKPSLTEKESRIVYLLLPRKKEEIPNFSVFIALQQRLKDGNWTKPRRQSYQQLTTMKNYSQGFTESEDKRVLGLLLTGNANYSYAAYEWKAQGDEAVIDLALTRLLQTGRAFADENTKKPLRLGEAMEGRAAWSLGTDGLQKPALKAEREEDTVLLSSSPWYLSPLTGETGPLRCGMEPDALFDFLDGTAVSSGEAKTLRSYIKTKCLPLPAPRTVKKIHEKDILPALRLVLAGTDDQNIRAFLSFLYEGKNVHPLDAASEYQIETEDEILLKRRQEREEKALIQSLEASGLSPAPAQNDPRGLELIPPPDASPWFWTGFLYETAPRLRKTGTIVETDSAFRREIVAPDTSDIEADFTQNGEWWFSLDLGISVGGQRLKLLPILVEMIRRLPSLDDIDRFTKTGNCYAPLPDGRVIALPAARVSTILKTLVELFDPKALDKEGKLRVSMDLAAAFVKLEAVTRKRWLGQGQLAKLVEKLGSFEGIDPVPVPKTLKAELRPYQTEGYHWLNFLGSYGLSGILADDMGLGKTVQALAYILALKEKKKLGAPALIVMPTSLIANWQSETARFAPSLKTLTLHGRERLKRFEEICGADIVFTTYPLLPRDSEILTKKTWSLIVLDEAQAIKNPSAKMTQAACALQAKQRLCLTGTPVENHLGEAWSLFTFLMPGLLGDHKAFAKHYRTPIEKGQDTERKDLLARRLRPFVLRRLKGEVAKELPPKTEMVRRVTLADEQRDLYEAVRHVMSDKVREEIAAKGMARSSIVILDALLKLRQTCCDPRLVKLEAARKVKESAKLDELMEMLPTLIEEGRKILLFSQFTSMLDLIKPELKKANIPFVELRGTTKDRATPIKQFQKGEVPLFLISLKAGGTGLNLTAADTVIHYDPWWNPSVENQATDRAHRIGQDKPVFVYKLIAEGTVEERILELQSKKSGLAAALFGDAPAAAAKLTPEDLKWLMG